MHGDHSFGWPIGGLGRVANGLCIERLEREFGGETQLALELADEITAEERSIGPDAPHVIRKWKFIPGLVVDELAVGSVRFPDKQIFGSIVRRRPACQPADRVLVCTLGNVLGGGTDANDPQHRLVFGVPRVQALTLRIYPVKKRPVFVDTLPEWKVARIVAAGQEVGIFVRVEDEVPLGRVVLFPQLVLEAVARIDVAFHREVLVGIRIGRPELVHRRMRLVRQVIGTALRENGVDHLPGPNTNLLFVRRRCPLAVIHDEREDFVTRPGKVGIGIG